MAVRRPDPLVPGHEGAPDDVGSRGTTGCPGAVVDHADGPCEIALGNAKHQRRVAMGTGAAEHAVLAAGDQHGCVGKRHTQLVPGRRIEGSTARRAPHQSDQVAHPLRSRTSRDPARVGQSRATSADAEHGPATGEVVEGRQGGHGVPRMPEVRVGHSGPDLHRLGHLRGEGRHHPHVAPRGEVRQRQPIGTGFFGAARQRHDLVGRRVGPVVEDTYAGHGLALRSMSVATVSSTVRLDGPDGR